MREGRIDTGSALYMCIYAVGALSWDCVRRVCVDGGGCAGGVGCRQGLLCARAVLVLVLVLGGCRAEVSLGAEVNSISSCM